MTSLLKKQKSANISPLSFINYFTQDRALQ